MNSTCANLIAMSLDKSPSSLGLFHVDEMNGVGGKDDKGIAYQDYHIFNQKEMHDESKIQREQ